MDREPPAGDWADQILDQVLPEDFEWRVKVRAYPLAALLVAGAAGFVLGRLRGDVLFGAVSSYAVNEATHTLTSVFDAGDEGDEDEP